MLVLLFLNVAAVFPCFKKAGGRDERWLSVMLDEDELHICNDTHLVLFTGSLLQHKLTWPSVRSQAPAAHWAGFPQSLPDAFLLSRLSRRLWRLTPAP